MFDFHDGSLWHKETRLEIPGVEIVDRVGKGANGEVFRGTERALSRTVAVKIWRRPAQDDLDRPREEAKKLAAMNHPLIVTIHRFDAVGPYPFAVMEYVHGMTMKEWLNRTDPSPSERHAAWRLVSEALSSAYQNGIYHGDPHTGNILMLSDSTDDYWEVRGSVRMEVALKLTDFGTSRLWSSADVFQERERRTLLETCSRLFAPDQPTQVIDLPQERSPELIVAALDHYAQYLYELRRLGTARDDHEHRNAMYALATAITEVPMFKPHVVLQTLESLGVESIYIEDFLGTVRGLNWVAGTRGYSSPVPLSQAAEVLDEYSRLRKDFIRGGRLPD